MELNAKQILLPIVIPTILLAMLISLGSLLPLTPTLLHPHKWYLLLFFVIISLLTHSIASYGVGKTNLQLYYFTSIIVRMFAAILLMFVYIFLKVEQLYLLVANFFVLYFFFLTFEIYFLLANLHTNSKTS